jgi:hypothetical protein
VIRLRNRGPWLCAGRGTGGKAPAPPIANPSPVLAGRNEQGA